MPPKNKTKRGAPAAAAAASTATNRVASPQSVPKVTRIVFTALLLDILAFTIILPLFPRLLQFYRDSEHGDQVLFLFLFIFLVMLS
jgi:hypothetical protein